MLLALSRNARSIEINDVPVVSRIILNQLPTILFSQGTVYVVLLLKQDSKPKGKLFSKTNRCYKRTDASEHLQIAQYQKMGNMWSPLNMLTSCSSSRRKIATEVLHKHNNIFD